jgi:hypothetical protein
MAAFGKEIFSRAFTHVDIARLLGGSVTVILGILVVLVGLTFSH